MRRALAPRVAAAFVAAVLLAACLRIDDFFFTGEPIDGYRWDEASPELEGDLTEPHASIVPASDRVEGFVTLATGAEVHWVLARREGAAATLIYAHGAGPHLGRFWDRVERLWSLGYQVLVYDYPGYGRSTGAPSEAALYQAADAIWDEVVPARAEIDPERTLLYGYSLGGAPTFHLAARTAREARRPRGVIAESVWCSIEAQIQDAAFIGISRELLARLELDNCARIAELAPDVPVTLLSGTEDRITSPRQMRLLEAATSGPVRLVVVEGAAHADIPLVAGERYDGWIDEAVRGALAASP